MKLPNLINYVGICLYSYMLKCAFSRAECSVKASRLPAQPCGTFPDANCIECNESRRLCFCEKPSFYWEIICFLASMRNTNRRLSARRAIAPVAKCRNGALLTVQDQFNPLIVALILQGQRRVSIAQMQAQVCISGNVLNAPIIPLSMEVVAKSAAISAYFEENAMQNTMLLYYLKIA